LIALPAINVLLALAWSNHPHHETAHSWFARASAAGWATCLFTQTGFLRLSLNSQIVGVSIDCQAALSLLHNLVAHAHHQYVESAPTLTAAPFDALVAKIIGYRQMADATLLHLARVHDMKLITFDQAVAVVCPWNEKMSFTSSPCFGVGC
jgi:toxin-antitoxin system PIN domain toxin